MRTGASTAVRADGRRAVSLKEVNSLTLNLAVSMMVFLCGVCIVCLLASVAVCIKTQEVHSRCVDILVCAYSWLEKAHIKEEQEVKGHEGTD